MLARAVVLGVLVSVACVAGCSRKSSHSTVSNVLGRETAVEQEPAEHDVCGLLDPKDVEAVLGAALAVPPYHIGGGTPQRRGGSCAYDDASFHRILVDVNWSGGAMVFRMYGAVQGMVNQNPAAKSTLHLADGSDVAGSWDEARVINCCQFLALRGDQTVSIDIGGTTAVTIEQAAKLADAALGRLDKPLPIDGSQGVQAALDYASHRPHPVDPCTLLSRADAESLMGPLAGDPKSDHDTCTYPRAGQGNINLSADLSVRWKGGYSELREKSAIVGNFAKGFLSGQGMGADAKKGVEQTIAGAAPVANPAWEASGPTVAGGVSAVKHDVLVSIDSMGLKEDQKLAVLAKAMAAVP
jgi:hypothetical protein